MFTILFFPWIFQWICRRESDPPVLFLRHLDSSSHFLNLEKQNDSLVQDIMEDRLFTFQIGSFKNIFNFFLCVWFLSSFPNLFEVLTFSLHNFLSLSFLRIWPFFSPSSNLFQHSLNFFFFFIQASWKYPICVGFFYSPPNFPSPVSILKEP